MCLLGQEEAPWHKSGTKEDGVSLFQMSRTRGLREEKGQTDLSVAFDLPTLHSRQCEVSAYGTLTLASWRRGGRRCDRRPLHAAQR